VIVLKGLNSPLIVTRGFGGSGTPPSGGFRIGGSATRANAIVTSGGLRLGGSGVSPKSFLAAVVATMRANATLINAIGGTRVYSTWPGAKAKLPFVLIGDYVEGQPGEEIENNAITITISVFAETGAEASTLGKLVQNAVDSPAMNRRSSRGPLAWIDGRETDAWRQPTLPPERVGKTAYGADLYRWGATYVFNFIPYFQS
jgi:hypothetical protein